MKQLLRRLVLGPGAGPDWVPVALEDPQSVMEVTLEGRGLRLDVTRNNVVASLRPLRVAIALTESDARRAERQALSLVFRERDRPSLVGRLRLALERTLPLADATYCIFRTGRRVNRCLPRARLALRYAYHRWQGLRHRDPANFRMAPGDLHDLYVFYCAPRPVALITVRWQDRGNLFPMDLIGPVGRAFSLALRSTSPAVELIAESRRIALSRIRASYTDIAYELGKHHKKRDIDWDALGFPIRPSARFGLPVPADALGVSELGIDQVHVVGSHTVFLGRIEADELVSAGERLFHVHGFYQEYRARMGAALPVAPRRRDDPGKMAAG